MLYLPGHKVVFSSKILSKIVIAFLNYKINFSLFYFKFWFPYLWSLWSLGQVAFGSQFLHWKPSVLWSHVGELLVSQFPHVWPGGDKHKYEILKENIKRNIKRFWKWRCKCKNFLETNKNHSLTLKNQHKVGMSISRIFYLKHQTQVRPKQKLRRFSTCQDKEEENFIVLKF